jgi:cyclic pyranopterin phosphate synthase
VTVERERATESATSDEAKLLHGSVLAVCVSPGGIPKHPVASARVEGTGVEGDKQRYAYHGGANRAVCLFSIEDYQKLELDGVRAQAPGAYGENLLTQGLDYEKLRAGDRLQVGDDLVLEIHDVREPCKTLRSVDARFPNLMLGRSGFVCRVLRAGVARAGMAIRKLD